MAAAIIVAFGNVTSEQCMPLREAMHRKGLTTSIVTVDESYTGEQIELKVYELFSDTPSFSKRPAYEERAHTDAEDQAVAYLFPGGLDHVKAYVLPSYQSSSANPRDHIQFGWLIEKFSGNVAEYQVEIGSDGSSWLAGHGFGDSLPSIEAE